MIHLSLFRGDRFSGSIFRPRRGSIRAMFNGQKPHHPSYRFFLYFAERRGPGCCCARADKKVGSNNRFSRCAPRNGQLGRPTRSLCSAGPESSGSIRCLLLRDLYAQQPRYMRSSHAMPCYAIGFAGLVPRHLHAQQPRHMRSSHAMPCYAIGFAGLVLARSVLARKST